jgi:hypothetical protein
MSKIFEVFGYPLTDTTSEASECRKAARCPFMGRDCDGGGNRYLSDVNVSRNKRLKAFFGKRKKVCAGVCSLQLREGDPPWIVCPRRLLVLGREQEGMRLRQRQAEDIVLGHLGYPRGTRLGVWPEVKLKYAKQVDGVEKTFDYTFDYIVMPIGRASQSEMEHATGKTWREIKPFFEKGGYTIAGRAGNYYVENGPVGTPKIIEIMTSSTSGGNKDKRTTIPMAFEDAILERDHNAPGINYRQVWARMVSQLIVKSEVAIAWGGKAIWIVQDVLVDYISASTALNVHRFLSEHTSEVNMLSFSYGDSYARRTGVIELTRAQLFAGPIASRPRGSQDTPSFQDMVRAPICPPLTSLVELLAKRKPVNQVVIP